MYELRRHPFILREQFSAESSILLEDGLTQVDEEYVQNFDSRAASNSAKVQSSSLSEGLLAEDAMAKKPSTAVVKR